MENNSHVVYMIYSKQGEVFYKGYTLDPIKRLKKHNSRGSTYTSRNNDWVLIFTRQFDNKKDALKYETMLKRQNRRYLEWIILQDFNSVKDFESN